MNATAVVPSAPLKKMGASPSFWCVSDGTDDAMHALASCSTFGRNVCSVVVTTSTTSGTWWSLRDGYDKRDAAVTAVWPR
jgi:hypothetical protein